MSDRAVKKRRGGLSNSLVGRRIAPTMAHVWFGRNPQNTPFDAGLPEGTAEIVAAWTEGGSVKVAAVDAEGRSAEFYLTTVKLVPVIS